MGGRTTHYNASLEVFDEGAAGTRLVWQVDLLPDAMADAIDAAMTAGSAVMATTLDALVA